MHVDASKSGVFAAGAAPAGSCLLTARQHALPPCRTLELLLAEGTVPMYYQGVKYNIPVAVWLPERYPLAPPLVYVVPTPDMVIKPRHTFVDASGGCREGGLRWRDAAGRCRSGPCLQLQPARCCCRLP